MNTSEIREFMTKDNFISLFYGGVYACDQLPDKVTNKPKMFIINTDPSYLPGKHWVAVYIDHMCEYFDSLGKFPNEAIGKFLFDNSRSYLRNTMQLQMENSDSCGLFCLFYSYYRCRGFTFHEILNAFNHNSSLFNEILVKKFYDENKS